MCARERNFGAYSKNIFVAASLTYFILTVSGFNGLVLDSLLDYRRTYVRTYIPYNVRQSTHLWHCW